LAACPPARANFAIFDDQRIHINMPTQHRPLRLVPDTPTRRPWQAQAMACLLIVLITPLWPAAAQAARQALVIGNAAYADSPLRNPVNDARAVEAKLAALGFTVQKVENLKRQQIGRTLTAFASRVQPGDEVVVFYAGHGLQVKGVNYLPAVDADIQSEDDVALNSLNLNSLLDRLDEAKAGVKLLFLDACRNNPYARSFRSGSRGLARVSDAPSGTLMHFATRPGSVAADGSGSNGLYTTELIRQIDQPGVPIEQMLKRVASAVERASQGQQEPWVEGSLKGDFYFKPGPGVQVASINPVPVRPGSVAPSVSAGLDLADLERADQQDRANRAQWAQWQQAMQAAFDKVGKLGEAVQAQGWERFISSYGGQSNPYSNDDKVLLTRARQALATLQARVQQPQQPAATSTQASARPGRSFKDCDECPEMVVIPAGSFIMGSPASEAGRSDNEGPQHRVSLGSFALGKFEVTQGQWRALMGSNPSDFSQCGDDCPVEQVSWEGAQQYINKLSQKTGQSYRLPSEAEWEYAARAGTTTRYAWGDTASHEQANYGKGKDECCGGLAQGRDRWVKTAPAGQFPANGFGLHDMHGNVYEWVQDVWHDNYQGAPTDGSAWVQAGDATIRVVRGGSWYSIPQDLRAAYRYWFDPSGRNIGIGLRVARTVP
jgi:formylglycine-generating enzyme required for sulfatase activity